MMEEGYKIGVCKPRSAQKTALSTIHSSAFTQLCLPANVFIFVSYSLTAPTTCTNEKLPTFV
jgi:hypothetical protein